MLQGVITDGDLRRHMGPELLTRLTGQVMTTGNTSIRPEALVNEALRTMNTKFITALFVLENERPIGIVHIHDCLRAGVA
jgi:arabinose-5-phosphate isomerase